jgi:hypothetical protein
MCQNTIPDGLKISYMRRKKREWSDNFNKLRDVRNTSGAFAMVFPQDFQFVSSNL